ncbi:MAG TPA: EamA family transporter [Gaiellaceae bacterium]|nr:EamA family transporter [Gaiellaceae bacterium]
MKRGAALGTIYLVWGSTYLAISVADRTLPPLLMLSVRFFVAGALLYGWCLWRGDVKAERPGRRQWGAAAAIGGLLLVVDTGGVALAEQRVPTGYAALLIASVPLFMAVLDRLVLGIRLPFGAVAGIAAGLLGVGLLVGPGGRVDILGTAVILLAALAWAVGSVFARIAPLPTKPALAAAMQLLCASVMLAGLSAAKGDLSHVSLGAVSPASLAALVYLVVFGSIVAFTAYGWLLSNVGTQLLSTYAYVNPAVAVLLGWAFIGERIGGKEVAAGLVILASVAMLFLAREPHGAEPTAESLEAYIRRQDAQAVEVNPAPTLAELRRIPA